MATLLVTGGSGFFGKSLLDAFARGRLVPHRIDRVIVVARQASRLADLTPWLLSPAVHLVDADVRALDDLFGADLVIHAAASADAARYREDPATERGIIVEGARRVAALATRAARMPALLLVGSGAVYGRQPPAPIPESAVFGALTDPGKADYASAKREAEAVWQRACAQSGLSAAIARCFAFVGPWLPLDRHFAVGDFLRNALAGEAVTLRASHPVTRSYLHADDLVEWLMRILGAASPACPAFNVGADRPVALRDLAAIIARMAGVPLSLPIPASGDDGIVDHYVPDIARGRRELGLRVSLDLESALDRTWRALRARAALTT